MTVDQLRQVAPRGKPALMEGFVNTLNAEGSKWGLSEPLALQHFVAQCAHESDGFRTFEEYASGRAYEGRKDLGNTLHGDGARFKGRGPIQITGRRNYAQAAKAIGIDYVIHPEWASGPINGCKIAMWYWSSRGLTDLALKDDIVGITKRINGGTNGLSSRTKYLDRCKKYLTFEQETPVTPPELPPASDTSLTQRVLGWLRGTRIA
jgi:putative chitinase